MKELTVTVVIKGCKSCRHKDHSGAFTHGGARNICGHDAATKFVTIRTPEEFLAEYPGYADDARVKNNPHWKHHWYHRIIPNMNEIPEWCPIRNGYTY